GGGRLAAGSLAVPHGRSLTVDDVRKRVRARFPRAAELPDRPELDRLLTECGVALEWAGDRYAPLTGTGSDAFSTATRSGTSLGALPTTPDAVAEAAERLAGVLDRHGFLAMLVRPACLPGARRALLGRLAAAGLVEVDVTRILVRTLREIGVPWQLVLESDARERSHPDRRNLEHAVRHAVLPRVAAALEAPRPVLLTDAAPLARYGCMDLLGRLADSATPRPAARLLLVPVTSARPVLDDQPIPVTSPAQLLWPADAWWQADPGRASWRPRSPSPRCSASSACWPPTCARNPRRCRRWRRGWPSSTRPRTTGAPAAPSRPGGTSRSTRRRWGGCSARCSSGSARTTTSSTSRGSP